MLEIPYLGIGILQWTVGLVSYQLIAGLEGR